MAGNDDIIELEKGYSQVLEKGIKPFLGYIEKDQREFFSAEQFVMLYDLLFKMCIQRDPYNWSEAMYERYTHSILDYLLSTVAKSFEDVKQKGYDTAFLQEWKTRWNKQKLIVKGLSKLFMYLDRFYTPNTDGILCLTEQGFKLYKENIFDIHAPAARQAILNAIDRERNSEEQDRQLLSEAVTVFVEMGQKYGNKKLKVYKSDLEAFIVKNAGEFYQRMSRSWMDQDSCPSYLEKAEKMLASESARVKAYLHHSTEEPLTKECYIQLLKTHQKELLRKKTGVFHLLTQNSTEDLSRLYRLYGRGDKDNPDLIPIADLLHEHIKMAGMEIIDKAKPEPGQSGGDANHSLVKELIALHAQYNKVVNDCFDKAQVFQKALKKAFEDFINKDNRVSKLLAKFVNDVLKKGAKVNIKDVDSTLDNIVFLYGYIQEKDVFERDYQLFLAQRLLNGLCENEHSEKTMIAKLKTTCGYQWTNKLEGMFKDVQSSKETMKKFKEQASYDAEGVLDLDVSVCTTGCWPSSKCPRVAPPKDIEFACEKFKRFYLNLHSGHKLEWRLDQGQAEVRVNFAPKMVRTLQCTTYQMMILLVFNSAKMVTLKQILDMTQIPKPDLANHLLSLCHPKVHVMLKRPDTKDLEDDHKFMLNPKYANKLLKVQIPLMKAVIDEVGDEQEKKTIELQRRHQMDAAIVRIMKTRKQLRHAVLVTEVVQQLSARFRPMPNFIKKRVEALIEAEYLERDPQDRSLYNYLA